MRRDGCQHANADFSLPCRGTAATLTSGVDLPYPAGGASMRRPSRFGANRMTASTTPTLLLSRLDCDRIEALLEDPRNADIDTSALEAELARAQVVEPGKMPA